MKKIIWLASYPKSGNTWVRAFLSYLLKQNKHDNTINELIAKVASSRALLEEQLCIETSELLNAELDVLRRHAYIGYANENNAKVLFIKIHDAFTMYDGRPIIPEEVTQGIVYIVRNPLDIIGSFAHHNNENIVETINKLNNKDYVLNNKRKHANIQLRQKLLSWDKHVYSWIEQNEIPIILIRYEDMVLQPLETFSRILAFCKLSFSGVEIKAAINATSFKELQQQEEKFGFYMKTSSERSFFRKGQIGSWRNELSEEQMKLVVSNQYDMMKKLNYLDVNDLPVY